MVRTLNKPLAWLKGEVKTPPFSAEDQTWRIVYHVATDAVVILEVFSKKTAATPNEVLTNCKKRLVAYIRAASGERRKRT